MTRSSLDVRRFVPDSLPIERMNLVHGACSCCCVHCGYLPSLVRMGMRSPHRLHEDRQVWFDALDAARERRIPSVVLTGGDPTERDDFPDILSYAVWLGLDVVVETHARRFANPEFARSLRGAPGIRYLVSLHGSRDEVHDRVTRVRGSFAESVAGIRRIRSFGKGPVVATTVLSDGNIRDLGGILGLLARLGVDGWVITYPESCGEAGRQAGKILVPYDVALRSIEGLVARRPRGRSPEILFNNIPFCVLGPRSRVSLNYRGYPSPGKGYELVLFPFALEGSYLAEMRIPRNDVDCGTCRRCFYRFLCPGPSAGYLSRWGERGLRRLDGAL